MPISNFSAIWESRLAFSSNFSCFSLIVLIALSIILKVLKPKKEKGLATLRVDKNVWNYMPKVKRVVKIPSSMMSSSWMGSHFTNDDLVKQSRMAEDYTFSITYEGMKDGEEVIEITCLPNKEAAVVWGKVEVVVYADNHIPLRMIYYDEDLLLSRTLEFTNIQKTFEVDYMGISNKNLQKEINNFHVTFIL